MNYRKLYHLRIENHDFAEGTMIGYVPLPGFDHAAGTKLQERVEAAARRAGSAHELPRYFTPASTAFPADERRSRKTTSNDNPAASGGSAARFFRKTSWSSANQAPAFTV